MKSALVNLGHIYKFAPKTPKPQGDVMIKTSAPSQKMSKSGQKSSMKVATLFQGRGFARSFLLALLVMVSCFGQAWALVDGIAQVKTLDVDHNGKVDRVVVTFTENVDIIDNSAIDGFGPIRLLNEKFVVIAKDYSATNASNLVLEVQEWGVPNTGIITGARYEDNTGKGSIVLLGTSTEIAHMQERLTGIDGAAPVLTEVFTTDADSGEIFVRFSEPVINSLSSVLTISNFDYSNASGDGASSISAMGSDTDGSDEIVRILLNTAIAPSDLNIDNLTAVGLFDQSFNPAVNQSLPLVEKPLFGALVQVRVHGPSEVGLGPQKLMSIDFDAYGGVEELEGLSLNLDHIAVGDLVDLKLVDKSGNILASLANANPSMNNFGFANNILIDHVGTSLTLTANVMQVPALGNVIVNLDPTMLQLSGVVNGGNQMAFNKVIGIVGPSGAPQIDFSVNSSFFPESSVTLGAPETIHSFNLVSGTSGNISEIKIYVNGIASDLFASTNLTRGGNPIAVGTMIGNYILFTVADEINATTAYYDVNVDMVATSPVSSFTATVDVSSFSSNINVVGSGISYTYNIDLPMGPVGPSPRDLAYGPVPSDNMLDRVVVEYGHSSNGKFSFYSELFAGNTVMIASANLLSPNGRVVNYVNNNGFWKVEAEMNMASNPFTSLPDLDLEFGSGNYVLTVDMGSGVKTYTFGVNPSLYSAVPSIATPVLNATVPVAGVDVAWYFAGSANFFHVEMSRSPSDQVAITVPGNTQTAHLQKDMGGFTPSSNYMVEVAAINVAAKQIVVSSDNSDHIAVIYQSWQEAEIPVMTESAPMMSQINLMVDAGFMPVTAPLMLGSTALIHSFKLGSQMGGNITGLHVMIGGGPADQLFTAARLIKNGTQLSVGTIMASNIDFAVNELIGPEANYSVEVDMLPSIDPMISSFSVTVSLSSFIADSTVMGNALSYNFAVNSAIQPIGSPRDIAYGPVPSDHMLDRVVVEYSHSTGGKLSFYSELFAGNTVNIVSASLLSPNGRTVNYVYHMGYWEAEAKMNSANVAFQTLSDLNSEFGAGSYTLTVDMGNSVKTYYFGVNPTLDVTLPVITVPVVSAMVPVTGVDVAWNFTGSANFFQVKMENNVPDGADLTVAGNTTMVHLQKEMGNFMQGVPYMLSVGAINVLDKQIVSSTDNSDQIAVIFQNWQEGEMPVTTEGTAPAVPQINLLVDAGFMPVTAPLLPGSTAVIHSFKLGSQMGGNVTGLHMMIGGPADQLFTAVRLLKNGSQISAGTMTASNIHFAVNQLIGPEANYSVEVDMATAIDPMLTMFSVYVISTAFNADVPVFGQPIHYSFTVGSQQGTPNSEIHLIPDMAFIPVTAPLLPGSTAVIHSFKLGSQMGGNVTGLHMMIGGPADQLFTAVRLLKNGSQISAGTMTASNIHFAVNELIGPETNYSVEVDLATAIDPMLNTFSVYVIPTAFFADVPVMGQPIFYSFTINTTPNIPNLRDMAYGPAPIDGGIDRVIIEYARISGNLLAFFSTLQVSTSIMSATLESPRGRVLNYEYLDGHWEAKGFSSVDNNFYSTPAAINAEFGSGNYMLRVDSIVGPQTFTFFLSPSYTVGVPSILAPLANAKVPVQGVNVDWTFTGSANFYEVSMKNPTDRVSMEVAGNVNSVVIRKNNADFFANTPYTVGVAAIKVLTKKGAVSLDGDNIDVIFQNWLETTREVITQGPTGAVVLHEDLNFVIPGPLTEGQMGAKVFTAFMTTDGGMVDVTSLRIAGFNNNSDISSQIASASLEVFMGANLVQTLPGSISALGIDFNGLIHVMAGSPVRLELRVSVLPFPANGELRLELSGYGVTTNMGPAYSNGPIAEILVIGNGGLGTTFIRNPRFEVGPEVHPISSATNITTSFTFNAGPNDAGFQYVRIGVPHSLTDIGDFRLAVASSPDGINFMPLVPSTDYQINYNQIDHDIRVHFTNVQTASTSNGGFYTLDFVARTGAEEQLINQFDLAFINGTTSEQIFADADAMVNATLINSINDAASIQIRFLGQASESLNVSFVEAEVDTTPLSMAQSLGVSASENVNLVFFVKGAVGPTDLGFNVVRINYPLEMTINPMDVRVYRAEVQVDGSVLYQSISSTSSTNPGQLRTELSALMGVGEHYLKIELSAFTGTIYGAVNFNLALNNVTNPTHPYMAMPGQAEAGSPETGLWNSLTIPVLQNMNLPIGSSLSDFKAEVETPLGYAPAGQDVFVTMNIKTLQSASDIGYNNLSVQFPSGYSIKGTISLSTNGSSLLNSTTADVKLVTADAAIGQLAEAKIAFAQVQNSGNLMLSFTLTAPEEDYTADFVVKAFNTGFLYSERWAYPADADGDKIGGLLSLHSVVSFGTKPNVSNLSYEVDVVDATNPRGFDLGFVATDATPAWRVFVKPEINVGDEGFNVIRLDLDQALSSGIPTDIRVFRTTSGNVISPATWNLLISGTNYDVLDLDAYSFRIKFRNTQADSDARYIVTFRRAVTSFPTFLSLGVSVDNTGNFGQVYGFVGDADNDSSDRNASGFNVEGSFSTIPNVSSAFAQISKSGNILTDTLASFSLLLKLEIFPLDKGVNVVRVKYPFDFSGMKILSVALSNTIAELSGNTLASSLYTVSTKKSGELELILAQTVMSSKFIRMNFQATMPSFPIFADFEVDVDNDANFNSFKAFAYSVDPTSVAQLGFEVMPSFSFDELKPIVVEATSETIVVPANGAEFVTPGSLPQLSVIFKAKVDSGVAGFNVVTLTAPAGFTLPQTFSVSKASTVTALGNVTNRLGSNQMVVNKDQLDNGIVKFLFLTTQDPSSLSITNGFTDGTAYYRIDFTPTAPESDSFGFAQLSLTNKTNPVEYMPMWGDVANSSELGITAPKAIDRNGMEVQVFVPYNENTLPVVSEVSAEVNVATGSGNYRGGIDMSTEGNFRVDVRVVISDNVNYSGVNRLGIDMPFGFSAPSAISVVKMALIQGVFVASNVQVETAYQADIYRLNIKLKDLDTDVKPHYYRVTFKSTSFDYQSPAYFNVDVDNSAAPSVAFAIPADVDGAVNNNNLQINVFQKALSTADLATYFTPVADKLVLEVSPQTASVSASAKEFSAYILADNIIGQRGFNRVVLQLPWDFANVSNVRIFRSADNTATTPDGFSKLAVGSGLSATKVVADDAVYGNMIGADFSSLMGVGSDIVIKVVFNADIPGYPTQGFFSAVVDDKSKSLPSYAISGNASSQSVTDDAIVFIEPDLANVDFSARLLSEFVAEVTAGNAIIGDNVTGTRLSGIPLAGQASFINVYLKAKKTEHEGGFDYLEVFMPFPIDGNRLAVSDVRVSSAIESSFGGHQSFVRIDPVKLRISKTDSSISIRFMDGALVVNDVAMLFRVRIPVIAPDESGLYQVGVRAFSSNVAFAGVDAFPVPSDAMSDVGNNDLEFAVQPYIDETFNASVLPVQLVVAEVMPNFVPTSKIANFSVKSTVVVDTTNSGYDQLKLTMPSGFGKPGSVSVKIDALDPVKSLDPSLYVVKTSDVGFMLTLSSNVVVSTGNVTLTFSSAAPATPSYGEFSLSVGSKSQPILAQNSIWGDVDTSDNQGDGTLMVNVYPDFESIVFVPPVDVLFGELTASSVDGKASVFAGTTSRINIFAKAIFDAGSHAGGFNLLSVHLPAGFGSFPTKVDVVVGSTNLLAGTSTGFTIDSSDALNPVIKFKQTYSSNVSIRLGFDIKVPSDANQYTINLSVNNSSVPLSFFAYHGFEDMNGNNNDGNGLSMFVFPQVIEVAANVYLVDDLVAEVVSGDIKVGKGATIDVIAKVTNTSGNGFDRMGILKNESLGISAINSVQKINRSGVVTNFVKDIDFSVIQDSGRVRLMFNKVQSAGNVLDTYKVNLSVNAPDAPAILRLNVQLDNTAISKTLVATPGNANGIATDLNNLELNIVPDFSSLLTGSGSQTLRDNLRNVFAETVVLNPAGFGKKAVAGSSNTIRIYIKPNFDKEDRGINKFSLELPKSFGVPSNVAVYSSNVSGRTKLDNNSVDFKSTVTEDNRIEVDFSVAQRATWKLLTATNVSSANVVFAVEFTTTLPEAGLYRVAVKVDNKSVPLPKEGIMADLNNNPDDDNDGLNNGVNDNNNAILVEPIRVSAEAFAARVNAQSMVSEILSVARAELGKTVDMSLASNVILGSSGNIDRLYLALPKEFSSVTSVSISRSSIAGGNTVRLTEITDYNVDVSDVTRMMVRFNKAMLQNVVIYVNFKVTLPSRSDSFNIAMAVDNSLSLKAVESVAGDAVNGSGSNGLAFKVDPAAYTNEDLLKTMMTSLTATISGQSTMLVSQSNIITMGITPIFSGSDVGFDMLNISAPGLERIKDFVVISKGAKDVQLFTGIDYKVVNTATGSTLIFTKPFKASSAINSLQISFTASSSSEPRNVLFFVEAASTSFPLKTPALVASNGTLNLSVLPPQKTAAELKQRPARPVADLLYDVAQLSGNAASVMGVDVFIRATSAAGTVVDGEMIPASSGFDSLALAMPNNFGTVSQLKVQSYSGNFSGASTELQPFLAYTYSVDKNNVVSISFLKEVLAKTGLENTAYVKVSFMTSLPVQPQRANISAAVNNSRNVNEVGAAEAELSGDGIANSKIYVVPVITNAPAKIIASQAKSTIVYPQDANGDVKADVGQAAFEYTIRVAATAVLGGVGFDTINIEVPKQFKNLKVTTLKMTSAGITSAVADYSSRLDAKKNELSIVFGKPQAVLGISEFSFIDIGLVARMPAVKKQYHHKLSLFNTAELTSMSVEPSNITIGGVGETGQLAVEVVKRTSSGQSKYGVFGQGSGTVLSSFTGSVSVWDDRNTVVTTDDAFTSYIYHSTKARNVIVQTTPVITDTESGFDYLQVDLPYGSGTPSNVVVFFRSASGNIVYLEDFYDFQVATSKSELTIEFSNAVNSTTLGASSGIFKKKLGEVLAAQNLFISFEMTMPNRLGTHFFDVFVVNSVTKSDQYYIDDPNNIDKRPVVSGVVSRSAQEDGTRFMRVDQQGRGEVVPAVESVAAEITTQDIDQFTKDLSKNARRKLRFDVLVNPKSSSSYDNIEVQMPEGFNTFSKVTFDDGNSMKQFRDYTIDLEHPRSVIINLTSKRLTSGLFNLTMDAQTPDIIPAKSVTYTFAVVVGDKESTTLIKQSVFATAKDVTPYNGGNDLSLALNDVVVITGSILLQEPALGKMTGTINLSRGEEVYPAVPFSLAEGDTSASFTLTNSNVDKSVINWPAGNYDLQVLLDQFKSSTKRLVVGNVSINSGESILYIDTVQATMKVLPSFLNVNEEKNVQLKFNINVASGNTLKTLFFDIPSSGFNKFEVISVAVGGEFLTPSKWSVANSRLSVDLGSVVASNVVISTVVSPNLKASYDLSATVVANNGFSVVAKSSDVPTGLPRLNVGEFLYIVSPTKLPNGYLGQQYSVAFGVVKDETRIGDVAFTSIGLPPGLSMSNAGVLSGDPLQGNKDGFSITVTVSGNGYSDTKNYTLQVYKTGFALYGLHPAVVPTTGGEFIVRGVGFSAGSNVLIGSSVVSSTRINQNSLRVTLPATAAGTYGVSVEDGGVIVGVPNQLNSSHLLVAESVSSSVVMTATVEADRAAKVTDYNIVGLRSFYQGSVHDKLVKALGSSDNIKWRAHGFDDGEYFELTPTYQEKADQLRPGSAFWHISRVSGNVDTTGVAPESVASYDFVIPATKWALVSNIYNSNVTWANVEVLAGNVENPIKTTVNDPKNIFTNVTLWGMDKSSSSNTHPYAPSTVMEPGKGYWVYNKTTDQAVTLKISRPVSGLSKATASASGDEAPLLYKADENLPPEAPEAYQKASASAPSAGGGGGCLLK